MLNQFTKLQLDVLSKLLIDIGKLFFGSVVVGFFIPSLNIPPFTFVIGIVISITLFVFGVNLVKLINKI